MNQSQFCKLGWKDLGKGALIAFVSAAMFPLIKIVESGALPDVSQLRTYALVGIAAALSYLLKNLFTNSNNELLKKE